MPTKTIKITIDEDLLSSVDAMAIGLGTSRSAFIHDALEAMLRRHRIRKMAVKRIRDYEMNPLSSYEQSEIQHDAEK